MIISKTPLRISFFSGGSDIKSFYDNDFGAALSVTIDKYIYVTIHHTLFSGLRTMYDTIAYESVDELDKMEHLITKEALKYHGVENNTVVTSVSDIPSKGSGLGSSSAFTVGLLNCLSVSELAQHDIYRREKLAKRACEIEIEKCSYPIGKQDQFAAAFGGFNLFRFNRDESVDIEKIYLRESTLKTLEKNLILFYSGRGRSANDILQKQKHAMGEVDKFELVRSNRNLAYRGLNYLKQDEVDAFGLLFHEAWMNKKKIVKEISGTYFDDVYSLALRSGAIGGKLLGAGGGGFFLFYAPEKKKQQIIYELENATECKNYDFRFVFNGTEIIVNA